MQTMDATLANGRLAHGESVPPNPATMKPPVSDAIPLGDGPHFLNIGSGETPMAGWTNLDRKNGVDIRALPVDDESCMHIRASHCLEHLPMNDALAAVRHWCRKLVPGGVLSIAVPDMEAVGHMLAAGQMDPMVWNYIFGGQTSPDDYHHCGFRRAELHSLLRVCGLIGSRPWYSTEKDCAALPISLNVRATKPGARFPDVAMSMTLPRLGFTETSHCVQTVGAELGMSLSKSTGVFWHHGLTRLIEAAIKANAKYVLTVDYDSVFTTGDVLLLIDLMEEHGLDAVCPVQCGREMQHILASIVDDQGELLKECPRELFDKPLLRVRTGHFGLTLLRTAAFEKLPKPWFTDTPDKDGGWGDGRVDSDIAFWLKWRDAGMGLHLANDCVIGHQQLLITWPDKGLQARHQYVNEWTKSGKPAWAR